MRVDTQDHKDMLIELLGNMDVGTNLKAVMEKDLKLDPKIESLYTAVMEAEVGEPEIV